MKGLNRIFKAYEEAKTEEVASGMLALAQMVAMYHVSLKQQGFEGGTLDALIIAYQDSLMRHFLAQSVVQKSTE